MIINSLLDTDLYKLTMQQWVLHNDPSGVVRYDFQSRTGYPRPRVPLAVRRDTPKAIINAPIQSNFVFPTQHIKDQVIKEIEHLCSLSFSDNELQYLASRRYFTEDYIEFLRYFTLNPDLVHVSEDKHGFLKLHIKGPWMYTILFETPVLAIISEIAKAGLPTESNYTERAQSWETKAASLATQPFHPTNLKVADFGTRRRTSYDYHRNIVKACVESNTRYNKWFVGTSNVLFAKEFGITPIGTMAHEYLQAHQGMHGVNLREFQQVALENWAKEYRGDLGIALTDTVNLRTFIRDFDLYLAKLFDGCRHDSGDPLKWGDAIIDRYHDMGIDPKTKTLVFSDGLTVDKAIHIASYFAGKTNTSFGIGTYLTNTSQARKLKESFVIKMTEYNDIPVAKLSDNPNKATIFAPRAVNTLKSVFG